MMDENTVFLVSWIAQFQRMHLIYFPRLRSRGGPVCGCVRTYVLLLVLPSSASIVNEESGAKRPLGRVVQIENVAASWKFSILSIVFLGRLWLHNKCTVY